jgi:hypothetical protein
MLDISNAACTPHWSNVRYIECCACIKFFSAHKHLLEQETETNFLWVPQQGLVFIRNNDVIYGGLGFDIIYVYT